MSEEHPHPLLAQVPLTVSPFLSLPTATPLPYTYKSLPSTLPPSVTDMPAYASSLEPEESSQQQHQRPAYVVSQATGHSAHPDDIIESCRALREHLGKLQENAEQTLNKWQDGIRERDLAEKRRIAPGWLDVGSSGHLLVPERAGGIPEHRNNAVEVPASQNMAMEMEGTSNPHDEGEDLDRVFGGLNVR